MTQRDRDRLVALKKAKKGLITQRQAAEEIGQSERHVRRLLKRLKGKGDGTLVHALRGRQSNRRLDEKTKRKALEILGRSTPPAEFFEYTPAPTNHQPQPPITEIRFRRLPFTRAEDRVALRSGLVQFHLAGNRAPQCAC
jgi:hypothetical protein